MGRGRIVGIAAVMALAGSLLAGCGGDKAAHAGGTTADPLAVPEGIDPTAPAGGSTNAVQRVDAAGVIRRLWETRQATMLTEDADGFREVDGGTLLTHDLSVAALVACGCEEPRNREPRAQRARTAPA